MTQPINQSGSPVSSSFVPQPEPIATQEEVMDPTHVLFKSFISNYYETPGVRRLEVGFPLIDITHREFSALIHHMAERHRGLVKMILEKDGTPAHVLDAYFLRLADFLKTGDPSQVVTMLKNMAKQFQRCLPDSYETYFVHNLSVLMETGKIDLFQRTLSSFGEEETHSKDFLSILGIESYKIVSDALTCFLHLANVNLKPARQCTEKNDFDTLFFQIQTLNISLLQNKDRLTLSQKNDLCVLFKSLCQKQTDIFTFFKGIQRCYKDLEANYFATIKSDAYLSTSEKTKPVPVGRHIQQHHEVFENFLPRVEEIVDWTIDFSEKLERNSLLLRFFPLYLEFGDLDRLHQRLEENRRNSRAIITEEILAFSEAYKTDRNLQLRTLNSLRKPENKALKDFNELLSLWLTFFSRVISHSHTLLDSPLECARKYTPDLFPVESIPVRAPLPKPKASPVQTDLTPTEREISKENPPTEPQTAEMPPVASPMPISYETRLQHLKQGLAANLAACMKGCRGFGTRDALKNAQIHSESLLCILKRVLDRNDSLSDSQLYAIILDVIRESTLAVEQTLSALDRSSNNLKDKADLKERLTHDLMQILMNCKNSHLPAKFRKWISEMNRGEILSRDLRECSIDGTFVEKLLTKARLLLQADSPFSRENCISDTFEFARRAGLICIELQRQIAATNAKPPSLTTDPLRKEWALLCKEAKTRQLSSLPDENLPPPPEPLPFTQPILEFRSLIQSSEVQNGLDNLLNNLCTQLQVELKEQETLEPFDAFHHMSKVILLNQMIVEHYLLNLCDALNISYSLKDLDHDLVALITSLGMSKKDFENAEWEFLTDGKALRLLTRYPSSYLTIMGGKAPQLEKAFKNAMEFSQSQIFEKGNQVQSGFVPVSKTLSKQLAEIKFIVQKDVQLLTGILQKISVKKTSEIKS